MSIQSPRVALARGFTLIEMLVVLAILGLSLLIVVGQRPARSGRIELDASARTLAGTLRTARATAIGRGRPVDVGIDAVARSVRVDGAVVQQFPGTLSVSENHLFRFIPDGSAVTAGGPGVGARVALTEGARHVVVAVDWLTGRVHLTDATPQQ